MSAARFETAIPVFDWLKALSALDSTATGVGFFKIISENKLMYVGIVSKGDKDSIYLI
jgi:hypothetical protein